MNWFDFIKSGYTSGKIASLMLPRFIFMPTIDASDERFEVKLLLDEPSGANITLDL